MHDSVSFCYLRPQNNHKHMPRGGNGFGYNPKLNWSLVALDAIIRSELFGFI